MSVFPSIRRIRSPEEIHLSRDGSLILAANSYVEPTTGNASDPYSEFAFRDIATAYCSGASLYCPLPSQRMSSPWFLFDLWLKAAERVPQLGLPDGEISTFAGRLKQSFHQILRSRPKESAIYLRYQFTEELQTQYLGAENHPELLRQYLKHIDPKLVAEHLPHMRTIQSLLPTTIPDRLARAAEGLTRLEFALAFFFEFIAKSPRYGQGLLQHRARPSYQPHPLRKQALVDFGVPHEGMLRQPSLFPWGNLLARIFASESPLAEISRPKITTVMRKLRDHARHPRNHWVVSTIIPSSPAERAEIEAMVRGFVYSGLLGADLQNLLQEPHVTWMNEIIQLWLDFCAEKEVGFPQLVSIEPSEAIRGTFTSAAPLQYDINTHFADDLGYLDALGKGHFAVQDYLKISLAHSIGVCSGDQALAHVLKVSLHAGYLALRQGLAKYALFHCFMALGCQHHLTRKGSAGSEFVASESTPISESAGPRQCQARETASAAVMNAICALAEPVDLLGLSQAYADLRKTFSMLSGEFDDLSTVPQVCEKLANECFPINWDRSAASHAGFGDIASKPPHRSARQDVIIKGETKTRSVGTIAGYRRKGSSRYAILLDDVELKVWIYSTKVPVLGLGYELLRFLLQYTPGEILEYSAVSQYMWTLERSNDPNSIRDRVRKILTRNLWPRHEELKKRVRIEDRKGVHLLAGTYTLLILNPRKSYDSSSFSIQA